MNNLSWDEFKNAISDYVGVDAQRSWRKLTFMRTYIWTLWEFSVSELILRKHFI